MAESFFSGPRYFLRSHKGSWQRSLQRCRTRHFLDRACALLFRDVRAAASAVPEEDTEDETVYRPDDFPFPRSRGRAGIELLPDKSFRRAAIGSADGSAVSVGTWELEDKDACRIRTECAGVCEFLTVTSVDYNRLAIRKERDS